MQVYGFIRKFQCLGEKCEDTCCKGWGMQVDASHKALYRERAPELLSAVTSGESGCVMKRDAATDYCVKFADGLCAIHRDYGTDFLSDACHFFPRITRKFGNEMRMSGALSCPEAARLALFEEDAFTLEKITLERLPGTLKDYLPQGITAEDASTITAAIMQMAGDASLAPGAIMERTLSLANSLKNTEPARWKHGIPMLVGMADKLLPPAEKNAHDSYFLLQILAAIVHATHKSAPPRLAEVMEQMRNALGVTIDPLTLDILLAPGKENHVAELHTRWQQGAAEAMAPALRRWIQAQLAMADFPFSGFGGNVRECAVILCIRFATVRLALMAHLDAHGAPPDDATVVRVVQSLSRFLDHLAEPALSLNLYRDAGWMHDARLRGLLAE